MGFGIWDWDWDWDLGFGIWDHGILPIPTIWAASIVGAAGIFYRNVILK